MEELKDYIQRLMARVQRYTDFSGGDPGALMDKAMIGKGQGADAGMIVVHVSNFVIPGDSVDISIDPATKKMRKIVIATMLDEDPISVNADFPGFAERADVYGEFDGGFAEEGIGNPDAEF